MGERKITRDGKIIQRKEDKMEISFGEYFDDQRDRMRKAMQNKNAFLLESTLMINVTE